MAKAARKTAAPKTAPKAVKKAAPKATPKTAPKAMKKAAPKSAKRSLALAAQLYSLRDHLAKPEQVLPTLKKVAKIGYKYVQLSGGCLDSVCPVQLKEWLDKAGLKAIGHHTSYGALVEKFDEIVERLHVLGVQYTAIAYTDISFRKDAANWKRTAKQFDAMAKRLAAEGITLQYHNHQFEFERFGDKTGLEILFGETKLLQAELDTAWVARGLQNPAAWILRMKGRMDQVHFKDMVIGRDDNNGACDRFAEIGNGNLDWKANVEAIQKIGVQDVIVEQDAHWIGGNPFKALECSYKFLRKMGLK